ncbi:MAG: nucleotidyltransferase domain-containing protein [Jatrophihabitantaceae bacterium]
MRELNEMTMSDVLAFLEVTDELGITPWVTGGWGVDALLGEHTRRHSDLDLLMHAHDAPTLVQHLVARGFAPIPREDTSPWNFVYGDRHGREVDFHLVERRADGMLVYGPDDVYPPELLDGYGTIGERAVRCLAPAWEVRFHTGYPVDEDDWHDVSALCARFGIAIPPDYDGFVRGRG